MIFCSPKEAMLPVFVNDSGTNFLAIFVNTGPANNNGWNRNNEAVK